MTRAVDGVHEDERRMNAVLRTPEEAPLGVRTHETVHCVARCLDAFSRLENMTVGELNELKRERERERINE